MPAYLYHMVDVFTSQRFGGNPLAVFPDAHGLDAATMQALATEMNYSETTFVLPPDDPSHTARVRIFNLTAEMPFAGHPNVGTAYVLAKLGLASGPVLRFEEISGLVEARLAQDGSVEIDAPQPLQLFDEVPADGVAACLSLRPVQLSLADHPPIRASVGVPFVLVAVDPSALAQAAPNIDQFRRLAASTPGLEGWLSLFVYAKEGNDIRARMFAPLGGTWEDPATGSANATLAAMRLHLEGGNGLSYRAVQGVEMGRRSELDLRAWRTEAGIRASVGGRCVPVFSGTVEL